MLGTGVEGKLFKKEEGVGGLGVGSFSAHSRFEVTREGREGRVRRESRIIKMISIYEIREKNPNLSPKNE